MSEGGSCCRGWGLESGLLFPLDGFSQTLLATVREATHSTVRQAGFHAPSSPSGGPLKDSDGTGGGWNAKNKVTLSPWYVIGSRGTTHCSSCTPGLTASDKVPVSLITDASEMKNLSLESHSQQQAKLGFRPETRRLLLSQLFLI